MNATDSVLDMFLELAAISSPPGHEREVADRVHGFLHQLGLETDEDEAGGAIGSEIGNIMCRVPATAPGTPIFLNAHLDTVPPTDAIEPVVNDGVVTNSRDAILGADNKAAVVAMLAAVRDRVQGGGAHAGVELVFTPMEEVGLKGAKRFDVSRLQAEFGYCYDHAAPIGQIVLAAPSQRTLRLTFRGRPSHSGMAPEQGRSAILAAARAIAAMPLGRIDPETTTNVGLIEGGVAGNIVPPLCVVSAEARSRSAVRLSETVQAILDACTAAASETGCEVEAAVSQRVRDLPLLRRRAPGRAGGARAGRLRLRARLHRVGWRRRRQRVQRRRHALSEPVQRRSRDPHVGRAHLGGRPRRHDRGHRCADRSCP